jgi:hypothetical protein
MKFIAINSEKVEAIFLSIVNLSDIQCKLNVTKNRNKKKVLGFKIRNNRLKIKKNTEIKKRPKQSLVHGTY